MSNNQVSEIRNIYELLAGYIDNDDLEKLKHEIISKNYDVIKIISDFGLTLLQLSLKKKKPKIVDYILDTVILLKFLGNI